MIRETATMEFVRTRTETEALLLEANLIKRLAAALQRAVARRQELSLYRHHDDHRAPGIFKHRGARQKSANISGRSPAPARSNRTINALQRAFLLRTCTDSVLREPHAAVPALPDQALLRRPAPARSRAQDYAELVDEARNFLSGKSNEIQQRLSRRMQEASAGAGFRDARRSIRDRLAALSHVQAHQGINPRGIEEADVFAVHQKGGITCVQVFFFRTGQNWGNRAYFPRADKSIDAAGGAGRLPRPVLRRQALPAR